MPKGAHLNLREALLFSLLTGVVLLAGCAVPYFAPVVPPPGGVFSSYKAPLMTNFDNTQVRGDGIMVSQKCTQYFFWPLFIPMSFAWDDASIGRIARDRGIKEVTHADYEFLNILGIYATFTVHVYGRPAAEESKGVGQ